MKTLLIAAAFAAALAGGSPAVYALLPEGRVAYTVKVHSKAYGDSQSTRQIASGQTDDYSWKSTPPGGPVAFPAQCASAHDWPVDENGALQRQTRVRLAPVVNKPGVATIQLGFDAISPQGKAPRQGSAAAGANACPPVNQYSEIVRFTLPLNGKPKTLTLKDGTQVIVSGKP
ncbi:DUF6013 family protein [Pararobbsia alpina]|uniref:Uncharacterized protein n=1 Tax=Pararobbsia alpina TaxID=621374 RepID=A0A6S7BDJ5_9BURK|nr:DUF6013 family protein [Pararobbsia alpina]CAB3796653.1 hypothetical protein LMG28138_04122 [Pararobbsia alpina]